MKTIRSVFVCLLFALTALTVPVSVFAQNMLDQQKLFESKISTAKKLLDMITEFFVKYSFQVLGGIIVIFVGWILSGFVTRLVEKMLKKKNVDVTVTKFLLTIVKIVVMSFAFLVALGKFGVTIAPFVAGLSVIGFAASFAVQGPLSNYAAGATLIFTKPFRVGDIVEVAGVAGEVLDMSLARTELRTLDGTNIYIPNKHVIGEIIHNFTQFKKLDMNVGISYESDVEKAISIMNDLVFSDLRIAKEPVPKIGISEFADSSINIYARLWCKQDDYWEVMFDVNKKMFDEFNKGGITIPFPQRDVHIHQSGTKT